MTTKTSTKKVITTGAVAVAGSLLSSVAVVVAAPVVAGLAALALGAWLWDD